MDMQTSGYLSCGCFRKEVDLLLQCADTLLVS